MSIPTRMSLASRRVRSMIAFARSLVAKKRKSADLVGANAAAPTLRCSLWTTTRSELRQRERSRFAGGERG